MAAVAAALPAISAVGTLLGGIASLTQKGPKAPKVSDTQVSTMPTEDSELVAEARRRTLMAQTSRGGRASTILTESDDKFGGN